MPADISFASFNLYNFQKVGLTTHSDTPVAELDYNAKLLWTRKMLVEMNADVVAFQELWHRDCLEDVLNTPELSDYRAIYIKDNNQDWYNIAVAMIVKEPWSVSEDVEVIKKFPFEELVKLDEGDGEDDDFTVSIKRFSRSILKVKISNSDSGNTPEICVFACHLKSKLPSRVHSDNAAYRSAIGSSISTIRRTAEAAALRMYLIDQMQDNDVPTVVIGDLNDDPLSNTLSLITQQPTISSNSRGGDKSLYSTLHLQQLKSFSDVYYTHEYKNHRSVLDHILVSEEFFEFSSDSVWKHKDTRLWNDHIEDSKRSTSDHGIIMSSFG